VAAGSAAQEAQQLLPDSTVIAAFHHVSAVLLNDPTVDHFADDVLVLGEDREAVAVVCELATAIPGARGVYAGRLRNAGQVEALAANLIAINRRYQTHAGLTITGVS
jgi:NADPH-dependent F420 reductase